MRSALLRPLSALALLLVACGSGGPPEDAAHGCAVEEPTLLFAAPEPWQPGWPLDNDPFLMHEEQLLFPWRTGPGSLVRIVVGRCGGPGVRLNLPTELVFAIPTDTPAGPRVYAFATRRYAVYLIDRLDVRGADAPILIGGGDEVGWWGARLHGEHLVVSTERDRDRPLVRAAGLGGARLSLLVHAGDATELAPLADEIVALVSPPTDEPTPLMALTDAGEVLRIDLDSGESTLVLAGARHAALSPGLGHLVWQRQGDDLAEPVFLRDLATDTDRFLTVNEFAARSWGRHPGAQDAGLWSWTEDAEALALLGPEGTLVAAFRTRTGEALEVPPHDRFHAVFHDAYVLSQGDRHSLWRPADGDHFVFHRGPGEATPLRDRGDALLYTLAAPGDAEARLRSTARASGASVEVLPRFQPQGAVFLDDGRVVTALDAAESLHDIVLADLDAGEQVRLAAGTAQAFLVVPELGVYYLDTEGEGQGLWLAPIPPR